jgi:hypothetical protein
MSRILFLIAAGSILSLHSEAQIYSQLYSGRQEMFLEAESFHLFEEYNEALPIYLELLRESSDNAYLNYKAGLCYLFIPGEKEKAISFLEKAVENIDHRNRRATFRTVMAPQDAWFYLGNAYHINYQFEKAIEMYGRFREILDPSVYNTDIVDEHIQETKNAMSSIQNPVFFLRENLGERINTRFTEMNPVVSGNEKVMVFSRKLQFYDGVFFSEMNGDGEWSWPVEITPQILSDGDCYPVSLSWDGRELYLYKSDDLVGNIYVSRFTDGRWTPIRKLNENINTRFWESHASISRDGNTLYFTSNRPGGFGGLDIYYSEKQQNGDWGPAVNLGPVINTPFNEETPFITEDGRTLYFSSYGHYNIGGYDVFYSTLLDDGRWSAPLNAGYGINTPDDDLFFLPLNNGIYAYFAKFSDEGFGGMDIFRYEIFSDTHPRKFTLRGVMKRKDGLQTGPAAGIFIIDPRTGDTLHYTRPDQITGEYEMTVEAGEWEIVFSEEGHDRVILPLKLAMNREEGDVVIDGPLERTEPQIPGIEMVITDSIIIPAGMHPPDIQIEPQRYITREERDVTISMQLWPDNLLIVEKYVDGELRGIEEIVVDRRRFQYHYKPEPGENILLFRYKDHEGIDITEKVHISYLPPPVEETLPVTVMEERLSAIAGRFEMVYESTGDLAGELLHLLPEDLARFLEDRIKAGEIPATITELIEMLISAGTEAGYGTDEITELLERIAAGMAITPPDEEDETVEPLAERRGFRLWWIILLAILLLAAFYYRDRKSGDKTTS